MGANDTDDLMQEFVEEAKTHIEAIENAFIASDELMQNADAINTVFRAIHSIKGTAGFFQLKAIVSLSHAMENVLGKLRAGEIAFNDDILDVLLFCLDKLKAMIFDVDNSNDTDISEYVNKLQDITAPSSSSVEPRSHDEKKPQSPPVSPKESITDNVDNLVKKGHKIYRINTKISNMDAFCASLSEVGCIIEAKPDAIVCTSVLDHELFCMSMELPPDTVEQIKSDGPNNQDKDKEKDRDKKVIPTADDTIRVHLETIENLMALSGEMVLARNRLLNAYTNSADETVFSKLLQDVDILTSRMQEKIMLMRMQPLTTIFNRFPRVIREMSKKLNKSIELHMEGKEIELDKTMIEAITDPLTHLIRNAVDHGIESTGDRIAANKPETGYVMLRAFHKSGMVAIEVRDDGMGIDAFEIKEKALEKDVINAEQAASMDEQAALRLIFKPGFSTSKIVTDISGRGVGMDVVLSNVEKLGGSVSVSTEKGKGTTITLFLPRTLALMHSLVVGTAGQRFAIPRSAISHVLSLNEQELTTKLRHINHSQGLFIRNRFVPVVYLTDLLGIKRSSEPASKIVILSVMKRIIGILVHTIEDIEEMLIKPLPSCMSDCTAYLGATIMGDGSVSMILDPDGLIKIAKVADKQSSTDKKNKSSEKNTSKDEVTDKHGLVMFNCSGPERYGIDTDNVARVVTVSSDEIEQIGEHFFAKVPINALTKTVRVIRPEDYLPVNNKGYKKDKLTLIILKTSGQSVGILCDRIIDNVYKRIMPETGHIVSEGVKGIVVMDEAAINNGIVIILNARGLLKLCGANAELVIGGNYDIKSFDLLYR